MALNRTRYRVYYEDGTEVEVLAMQRDLHQAQLELGNRAAVLDDMYIVKAWAITYHALKRANMLPEGCLGREHWESTVLGVEALDTEPVNPGQPEASQTGPSDSPSDVA